MKHVHVWSGGVAFLVSVNRNCNNPGKSGLSALWNRTGVKKEEEAMKWELGKGSKRWTRGRHSPCRSPFPDTQRKKCGVVQSERTRTLGHVIWRIAFVSICSARGGHCGSNFQLPTSMEVKRIRIAQR